MQAPPSEQVFHRGGIQARLRCYGGRYCTLDVSVPGHWTAADRPLVDLEVLWQPLDARTGLPQGAAHRFLHEPLRLVTMARQARAVGRSCLPGVDPAVAPHCYYRIASRNGNR